MTRSVGARRLGLLALIASATPIAFALEYAARARLATPEMREVYEALGPSLTAAAWWLVPVPALLGLPLGRLVSRRVEARTRARLGPAGAERAGLEALFLATSVPQVLGLLCGDFVFLLGADPPPVLATIGAAVATVFALGLFPPRVSG